MDAFVRGLPSVFSAIHVTAGGLQAGIVLRVENRKGLASVRNNVPGTHGAILDNSFWYSRVAPQANGGGFDLCSLRIQFLTSLIIVRRVCTARLLPCGCRSRGGPR